MGTRSRIDIANAALMRIGVTRFIDSFDDRTVEAAVIKRLFEPTRLGLLRREPWAFARSVRELELTDLENPPWRFVYRYPQDALRIFWLVPPSPGFRPMFGGMPPPSWPPPPRWPPFPPPPAGGHGMPEFSVETVGKRKCVCANVADARALVVSDTQNYGDMDEGFAQAFADQLAVEIAAPLCVNSGVLEAARKAAQASFENARAYSLDEERELPDPIPESIGARL